MLSQGNLESALTYAVNFGRASDTIGALVGILSGAFSGATAIKSEWMTHLREKTASQEELAVSLVEAAQNKLKTAQSAGAALRTIADN